MSGQERAREIVRGLYPIVDVRDAEAAETVLARLRAVMVPGVRIAQLRAKHLSDKAFVELARAAVARARAAKVALIVNDRADIARSVGADGVHLGTDDLPIAAAREILGPEALIGRSTDTPEEARDAQEAGADYVAWGSVWPTSSKHNAASQEGPEALKRVREVIPITPLVAIGGITLSRVAEIRSSGADAFAVIAALRDSADPEAHARRLLAAWEGSKAGR